MESTNTDTIVEELRRLVSTITVQEATEGACTRQDVERQLASSPFAVPAERYWDFLLGSAYISDEGNRVSVTMLGLSALEDDDTLFAQVALNFADVLEESIDDVPTRALSVSAETFASMEDTGADLLPIDELDVDIGDQLDDIWSAASEELDASFVDLDDMLTGAPSSEASPDTSLPDIDAISSEAGLLGSRPFDDVKESSASIPALTVPPLTKAAPKPPPTDRDPELQSTSSSSLGSTSMSRTTMYERHDEIGNGGIGSVYRGTQTRLGREVAIKEIREIFHVFAGVERNDIVNRFETIAQTQSRLSHPNIIQTIDVSLDEEYPYLVMELAPLGNLRRFIDADGRPPLTVGLKYFLQILYALANAHDAQVIHGGLKPENVVLDASGNAKLTDFGISRVVEHDSSNKVYVGVGTVAYMSPEQFRDPNAASVKSDIYSLGIMFYEMLTGKVPGRRSPMPSSFFPDIPRKLDDIFDRMSMDAEDDRYDLVNDILVDFYSSDEVMQILDKRSGVLFLRDPMTHGEVGLGQDVELPPEPAELGDSASVATPATSFDEPVNGLGDVPLDVDADPILSEAEDEDVMGKLEAYEKLFEE